MCEQHVMENSTLKCFVIVCFSFPVIDKSMVIVNAKQSTNEHILIDLMCRPLWLKFRRWNDCVGDILSGEADRCYFEADSIVGSFRIGEMTHFHR